MSDAESDDGRRASKKRKASRACDRCNSQHQPCDNATPKCAVCVRAGTECTYNRPVRKRGPRSGYTGQNGERLWTIVLQARPDIEDVVLQVLRRGTYSDTGIPNLDYFRNQDNQSDLVNKFNESRLGRFLQHGESPDLHLPPLDQEFPSLVPSLQPRGILPPNEPGNGPASSNMAPGSAHQHSRAMSSGSAANSSTNPHGAPQNPGNIYVQSEEIRKRVFESPQDKRFDHNGGAFPRESTLSNTHLEPNGSISHYGNQISYTPETRPIRDVEIGLHTTAEMSQSSLQKSEQEQSDMAYTSQWLDSIPADTLLNLGFAPGEGMEQDFFDLCANPDPIDSTPGGLEQVDQDEDEEVVWRRLVMRGRFI